MLRDPASVLRSGMAGLATVAGVSEPTVMRFCNAVGCSGFQSFKLRLAQTLALGIPVTQSAVTSTTRPPTWSRSCSTTRSAAWTGPAAA